MSARLPTRSATASSARHSAPCPARPGQDARAPAGAAARSAAPLPDPREAGGARIASHERSTSAQRPECSAARARSSCTAARSSSVVACASACSRNPPPRRARIASSRATRRARHQRYACAHSNCSRSATRCDPPHPACASREMPAIRSCVRRRRAGLTELEHRVHEQRVRELVGVVVLVARRLEHRGRRAPRRRRRAPRRRSRRTLRRAAAAGTMRPIAAAVTSMRSASGGSRDRRRPTRSVMPAGQRSAAGSVHSHAAPVCVKTFSSAIVRRSCTTRNALPSVWRSTKSSRSSPRSVRCSAPCSHSRTSSR